MPGCRPGQGGRLARAWSTVSPDGWSAGGIHCWSADSSNGGFMRNRFTMEARYADLRVWKRGLPLSRRWGGTAGTVGRVGREEAGIGTGREGAQAQRGARALVLHFGQVAARVCKVVQDHAAGARVELVERHHGARVEVGGAHLGAAPRGRREAMPANRGGLLDRGRGVGRERPAVRAHATPLAMAASSLWRTSPERLLMASFTPGPNPAATAAK